MAVSCTRHQHPFQLFPANITQLSYLGDGEEALGDVNDAGHLLDVLDAGLDGLGVVGAGRVEDIEDLLVLTLSPLLVSGTAELDQGSPDAEKAEGDDCLLVDDIVLVAQGIDREAGEGREDGRLGEEVAAGKRIDEGLGLGLGVLGGDTGAVARRDGGREGGQSAGSDARPETGSPCGARWSVTLSLPSQLAPRRQLLAGLELTESTSRQAGGHCEYGNIGWVTARR